MPLDHFVSQVHLKNFYTDRGRLVGVKKDDLKKFYAKSEDVCRRIDGNTNGYLTESRVIEEFLKRIEPNYNMALDAIRRREIDAETVYVIAGFVAYVMSCSPTGHADRHATHCGDAAIGSGDVGCTRASSARAGRTWRSEPIGFAR